MTINTYPEIRDLIALIDIDNPDDPALYAVQTVTVAGDDALALRVHMACEPWRVLILRDGANWSIRADGTKRARTVAPADLASAVRRLIFETDEAQAEGRYIAPKRSGIIEPPATPPAHMDIPVWDAERKRWYDAEV
jgi:hypothetical protein